MSDLSKMSKFTIAIPSTFFAYEIGSGMMEDREHETTRNTAKKVVVSVAQGFASFIGYHAGYDCLSFLESSLAPISTGVVGGFVVGYAVRYLTGEALEELFNSFNYNIKRKMCSGCEQDYILRVYKGDKNETMCPDCDVILRMLRVHLQLYREREQQ